MKNDFNPNQEKYVKDNANKTPKSPSNNSSGQNKNNSLNRSDNEWSEAMHDSMQELEALLLKKKL